MTIYLSYGPKGSVTTGGFAGQIELQSVSFSAGGSISAPVGDSQDRRRSYGNLTELSCSKVLDNASGQMLSDAHSLQLYKQAVVTFTRTEKTGPKTFLTLTLDNPVITRYGFSSGPDSRPVESFTINFTGVTWQAPLTNPDGSDGAPFNTSLAA